MFKHVHMHWQQSYLLCRCTYVHVCIHHTPDSSSEYGFQAAADSLGGSGSEERWTMNCFSTTFLLKWIGEVQRQTCNKYIGRQCCSSTLSVASSRHHRGWRILGGIGVYVRTYVHTYCRNYRNYVRMTTISSHIPATHLCMQCVTCTIVHHILSTCHMHAMPHIQVGFSYIPPLCAVDAAAHSDTESSHGQTEQQSEDYTSPHRESISATLANTDTRQ